jgi:DNA-binding beta-propeller fold protein YncE
MMPRHRLLSTAGTAYDGLTMTTTQRPSSHGTGFAAAFLVAAAAAAASAAEPRATGAQERSFLYAAVPGIRNYVEFGGVGLLVFDRAEGYKFVKRIPTWPLGEAEKPENVKGIAASAADGRVYVTTIKRIAAFDILAEKKVWESEPEGGCDRMAISPDGKLLYVPSFEGPNWNVLEASTGKTIARLEPNSRAHNTVYGLDGRAVYLAGLGSPLLSVADPETHKVVKTVGPFAHSIRPFTVNGKQTLAYVNVNELLGFEIGDIATGRKLHRVEVQGFEKGPVKRHGCPSHGVGLTPDESEVWVVDAANQRVHVFDNTILPPKQGPSIALRDQPGWITFTLDGQHAIASTGEVIDVKSKKIVAALGDENGREVHSEKVVEVIWKNGKPVRNGDQFGVGRKR